MNYSDINLFEGLNKGYFNEIMQYISTKFYKKKEMIFSEGDSPDWLYIVEKGKVKITKVSQDGKEIILEIISSKDFFGAMAVLKGFPYPANAFAMEDSKVLKISRKNLLRLLDSFPGLMYNMTLKLGERMKDSHETLKNIALERVEARIASLLLKLAIKKGEETVNGTVIDIKLTKQDIAEMVGTTVETSIRTISRFKKEGIVDEKGGKLYIKNKERLEMIIS